MPVVGAPEGWEYGAAQQRAAQTIALQNAMQQAKMGQMQREEERQNALAEALGKASAGPEPDMNAIARALFTGGQPAIGVSMLKQATEARQAEAQRSAMGRIFGGREAPQIQQGPPAVMPTQIPGISQREQMTIAQDMAMNPPRGGAQYVGAIPGGGMTQAELSLRPQAAPGQGGSFGEFLSHPNPEIQRMARAGLAIGQSGGFKDVADVNAYLERMAAAAVNAGNISQAVGAMQPAIDTATGRSVFVARDRTTGLPSAVPGFAPPPSREAEGPVTRRMMTPQEITERGLPEGMVAQIDSRGGVHPIAGAAGMPKALPISASQKLLENNQNLRKAEQALSLIQGKEVGGAIGSSSATGIRGYMPESILQRIDPSGIDTRAAIADIGSMIIHDRSGAAVTASEYPRLRPFIPLATDDPKTVEKKLGRFVQEYRNIVEEAQDFYKETGYKVPELRKGTGTGWSVVR